MNNFRVQWFSDAENMFQGAEIIFSKQFRVFPHKHAQCGGCGVPDGDFFLLQQLHPCGCIVGPAKMNLCDAKAPWTNDTVRSAGNPALIGRTPIDVVLAEAEKAARRLANGPTRAYGQIRRLFTTVIGQSFESQLEDEAQGLSNVAGSADAREGITAFVEKRKPQFTGK